MSDSSTSLANPTDAHRSVATSLSARLKSGTADSHRRVEELLRLPASIRDLRDYGAWLSRFYGFYAPLEEALAAAAGPCGQDGIEATRHAQRLVVDLRTLAIDPVGLACALPSQLPHVPTFAHVVGARYVLMGATLGGRLIVRDLDARLGIGLGTATRFFRAGGPTAGPTWPVYRDAIDRFGRHHPQAHMNVVAGAVGTFDALRAWFAPFCARQSHLQ